MVICQDDARNTTGCGKGHLQDGESAAIRTIARPGWPQYTTTDWEGDIPKDQDKVRDRREHCSSWTGLDDLRGRQLPSPFLYVHILKPPVGSFTQTNASGLTSHLVFPIA